MWYSGPGMPTQLEPFPVTKTDADLIKDSVIQILLTRLGERIFVPDFGCRLLELLFEPLTPPFPNIAKEFVRDAIVKWEPRVQILNIQVDVDADNNQVIIFLEMLIIKLALNIDQVITVPIPA